MKCRGLRNIVRLYIKKANYSEWEQVSIPSWLVPLCCYLSGYMYPNQSDDLLLGSVTEESKCFQSCKKLLNLSIGLDSPNIISSTYSPKHIAIVTLHIQLVSSTFLLAIFLIPL